MYVYVHKPIASKTHFFLGGCQKKSMSFSEQPVFFQQCIWLQEITVKLWEITGTVNCEQITALRLEIFKTVFFKKMRCLKIFSKTVFCQISTPQTVGQLTESKTQTHSHFNGMEWGIKRYHWIYNQLDTNILYVQQKMRYCLGKTCAFYWELVGFVGLLKAYHRIYGYNKYRERLLRTGDFSGCIIWDMSVM